MTRQKGVAGEKCLWHFARECSDASYACSRELPGSQNVTESHWTLHFDYQMILVVKLELKSPKWLFLLR